MKRIIRVCNGRNCSQFGAKRIFEAIKKGFRFDLKSNIEDAKIDINYCQCMVHCSSAPNVAVNNKIILLADEETICKKIEAG